MADSLSSFSVEDIAEKCYLKIPDGYRRKYETEIDYRSTHGIPWYYGGDYVILAFMVFDVEIDHSGKLLSTYAITTTGWSLDKARLFPWNEIRLFKDANEASVIHPSVDMWVNGKLIHKAVEVGTTGWIRRLCMINRGSLPEMINGDKYAYMNMENKPICISCANECAKNKYNGNPNSYVFSYRNANTITESKCARCGGERI